MRIGVIVSVLAGLTASSALAQNANVRAVHASPDAPNVDIRVNGGLPAALTNVPFRAASPYLSVPAATYNFQVTPTGLAAPVVINANVPLAANTTYTVAAVNTLANIEAAVFVDDNSQRANAARIRFIHASPNVPLVNIGLVGSPLSSNLFSNVSFKQSGGYIEVPGGSYNLEVRVPSLGLQIPLPALSVTNNQVYTVWAMGLFQGTPGLEAVVTVDQVPTPGVASLLALAGVLAARRRRV